MKIKQIKTQHRNDYTADMVCEHCGHVQPDNYGYMDTNYMENVIPRMHCNSCGKTQLGETKHETT